MEATARAVVRKKFAKSFMERRELAAKAWDEYREVNPFPLPEKMTAQFHAGFILGCAAMEGANCVAVQQVTDAPETVEVAFKTVEVERLGHLLVQLSPATPRNGAATVRRLMEEMNIKEVVS